MTVFVVKRLGKNGIWAAVSLIDKNGSFRGEAKFQTREDAEEYLKEYIKRVRNRSSANGVGNIKVFDEQELEKKNNIASDNKKLAFKSKKKPDFRMEF